MADLVKSRKRGALLSDGDNDHDIMITKSLDSIFNDHLLFIHWWEI